MLRFGRDTMVACAARTNTPSMLMSNTELERLVATDVRVEPEEKAALVQRYTESFELPLASCASCGMREPATLNAACLGIRDMHDIAPPMGDAPEAFSVPAPDDSWGKLEVNAELLSDSHPAEPMKMRGMDVCLRKEAYPHVPIRADSVGWRAEVQRQRRGRGAQVHVMLFGHWFDLDGGLVAPLQRLRDVAPGVAAARRKIAKTSVRQCTWFALTDLEMLRMTEAENRRWLDARERLKDMPLLKADGTVDSQPVDLSAVCSVYDACDGGRPYWLHPDLIDHRASVPACLLCKTCAAALSKGERPPMNVANVDYGALSRVPRLERLSLLEEMLLSPLRLYHVVVKVRSRLC